MSPEQMILPVGVTIKDPYGDHYRIEALLGKGSFGAVYLARNRRIPKSAFALKEVINPDSHGRERLLSECEILKRLDHRALPRVYHAFANANLKRIYLLMDYVQGKNLEELLREQPGQRFPLDLALAILAPIVDALIYMHNQVPAIIHRDIKPANIIMPLNGGEAVLVDFGTAKEYVGDTTTKGFRQVSPGFAAIEQYGAKGGTDMRTDVYGLAATLYALVTGVTPVAAVSRLINEKEVDPLKPVKALVPSFPADVSEVIARGLAINKSERFSTVEAFWRAIHQALEIERVQEAAPPLALPSPAASRSAGVATIAAPPAKSTRAPLRGPLRPLLLVVALCIILVGAGVALLSASHLFSHAPSALPPGGGTRVSTSVASASPPSSGLYPSLATSYAGTISDLNVAQEKTAMTLTEVQARQGMINGVFKGLGQVGYFSGTLSPSGAVHFTVPIQQGSTPSTLAFTGVIKIGGDLAGDFYVLNQNGQRTGEYGIWNVMANR